MKHSLLRFLLLVVSFGFLSGCSGGLSPDYNNYNQQLRNQMQEMINTLFGGHRTEFMQTYVDPSYITKMGGVDAATRLFTDQRASALQAALRVAKQVQPTYDEAAKQMTYYTDGMPQPIVFKQKGGKWYLQDDWFRM